VSGTLQIRPCTSASERLNTNIPRRHRCIAEQNAGPGLTRKCQQRLCWSQRTSVHGRESDNAHLNPRMLTTCPYTSAYTCFKFIQAMETQYCQRNLPPRLHGARTLEFLEAALLGHPTKPVTTTFQLITQPLLLKTMNHRLG
jgi:hypothetical protein